MMTTRKYSSSSKKAIQIIRPFKWIFDLLGYLLWLPYHFLVNAIGNFLADILEHPRLQNIAATTMAQGMKLHMEDPNFARRAAKIYIQLQEDADMSRQLGEQFPKVAASFIAGAARGLKRQASFSKLKQSLSKDNKDTIVVRPPSPPTSDTNSSICSTNDGGTTTFETSSSPVIKNDPSPLSEKQSYVPQTPKQQQQEEPLLEAISTNSKDEDVVIKLSFPWQGFGSPGGTMKRNDSIDDADANEEGGDNNSRIQKQQISDSAAVPRRRGQRQHESAIDIDDDDNNNNHNNNKEGDAILKFWKGAFEAFERKLSKEEDTNKTDDCDNNYNNDIEVLHETNNNSTTNNRRNFTLL